MVIDNTNQNHLAIEACMHVWHLGGCAQVQSSTGIHHLHTTLSCSCCDAVGGGTRV